MVLVTFPYGRPRTSFVGLDERCKRLFHGGGYEIPLTIGAPLKRVWPVAVTDNVLRELRASLNLGLQQVTLVEEQDERGVRQQFVRDDRCPQLN